MFKTHLAEKHNATWRLNSLKLLTGHQPLGSVTYAEVGLKCSFSSVAHSSSHI